MNGHPAVAKGRVAVVTGAARGIGLATAKKLASFGMKVCLADIQADALKHAAREVGSISGNEANVLPVLTDVSNLEDVQRLQETVYREFGEVALLMNNAAIGNGGGPLENPDRWRRLVDVNLWGVINGAHIFAPPMIAQGTACAIVNTGSKQGITAPPGDAAYNVTKAGVKVFTEALAHKLRNIEGCKITAHLLIPGFTFTHMTAKTSEKPAGAWTPEQVADYLLAGMARGDFYILCPDNEVTTEMDHRRVQWAADDIIKNRPALSRWHPDYADEFESFMKGA